MTKFSTIFYSSIFALTALSLGSLSACNAIISKEIVIQGAWSNLGASFKDAPIWFPTLCLASKVMRSMRDTLLQATQVRQQISLQNLSQLPEGEQALVQSSQAQLSHSIRAIMAIAESYPSLKADGSFQALQHQLEGCENRITIARNNVNLATQEFNTAIATFPNSLVNRLFLARSPKTGVQVEPYALKAPEVRFD